MSAASDVSVANGELPLERVYRWERERADRVFLTQPGGGKVRDWTWAQAMGEARRMAAWLKAQNWEPGSRICILSKNCAWWVMADLATWMSGHVSVPVYPSLRAQSVRQIIAHCQPKACFVGAVDEKEAATFGIPEELKSISFPTAHPNGLLRWDDIVAATGPLLDAPTRPADDLATIIYTSGTTGMPKGVMHRFGALSFLARALARTVGLTDGERALSYLPLAHIVERTGMETVSFYLGSRLFFTEGLDTFLADLRRARPTIFLSVPRLLLKFQQGVFAKVPQKKLNRLLRVPLVNTFVKRKILDGLGLGTVRFAASGAAPLPAELLHWYRGLGLDLCEGYGMTEILITHLGRRGHVRAGCVGQVIDNAIEAKIAESGELLVRSPMNMLGYYRDPETTRESFTPDGFFRTGDIGVIEPDGQLRLIGRIKEQFKTSKGKYVAPAPIESKLAANPDVGACCLLGAGMAHPFAIVLLSAEARRRCGDPDGREDLERSLRAQMEEVNAGLDPHERVAFLAIVEGPWNVANGLVTPTLKIRRSSLEARYEPLIDEWKKLGQPIIWERTAA
jgi:long-chain acyl-CoA synthetase